MPATIHTLYPAKIAPNRIERAFDELELAQAEAKRAAREANRAYVSPRLERAAASTRTEAEARAQRLHPVFQEICDAFGLTVRS
jgi:hypothetical protein